VTAPGLNPAPPLLQTIRPSMEKTIKVKSIDTGEKKGVGRFMV
jgi:hypothetical protein